MHPHQFHGAARAWLSGEPPRVWRTCSTTEMGFVRLSSNPSYTRQALSPPDAVAALGRLVRRGDHEFLREHAPCTGPHSLPIAPRLQGHRQITDAWLLAMAELHDVELVTFDARVGALSPYERLPTVLSTR